VKCHYENVKGVGKVLIPGCMAVAVTGDIDRCTCHPTTFASFEKEKYQQEVKRLKKIIKDLEEENDFYAKVLAENEIKNPYRK
jgi:hypothetical protein